MEETFLLKSKSVAKNCMHASTDLGLHIEMWRTENNYNDDAVKPLVFA